MEPIQRLPHARRDYLAAALIAAFVGPLLLAPSVVVCYAWLTDGRAFHDVWGYWGILYFWCYVVGIPVGVLLGAAAAALERRHLRCKGHLSLGFATLTGIALALLPQVLQILVGIVFSVREHTFSIPKATEWQEIAAVLLVGVPSGVVCSMLNALVVRRGAITTPQAVGASPESPPPVPASSLEQ